MEHDQVELAAELPVVALLRLLEAIEVLVEIVLLEPRRAVDALQHLPLLVAAPVCAGGVEQLEVLQPARVGDVRALAQVDERPVGVGRDDLVRVGEVVEALELERIVDEPLPRFDRTHLLAHERELLRRDLPHLLLERLEVLGRERRRDLEVVVEAVLDRGAESDLRVGTQPSHRRRQHVRGGVPQHAERFRIALGEDAERAARAQGRHEVLDLSVDGDGDGGREQPLADRAYDVGGERAGGDGARRSVGQDQCQLGVQQDGSGGAVDHVVSRWNGSGRVSPGVARAASRT